MVLAFGGGQTSRVDSVHLAAMKAAERNHSLQDSILASDAFFPFKDSIELAKSLGNKRDYPARRSIRDAEIIETCNKLGIAMVFYRIRTSKH